MFSQTEREFLMILAETPRSALAEVMAERFPNPVYRRKLLWGIRQKAASAAEDWSLYARAARREERVMPPRPLPDAAEVPLYTEPFAVFLRGLQGRLSRKRTPQMPSEDPQRPGGV
ncbi:MAG: hypothetical protein M1144_05540 [Candidatus Thermoplasmatota archaeon]|jgi:hypothetical protein|nr:hypothetical protein [Candidatus Thermoplasmatota archaeon]MCL5983954.1 hypothetical protein [Candidatus Thermoplasmatota archaeon]